jgi:hypothetical protein
MDVAGLVAADSDDRVDREQRRESSDRCGKGAEYAQLRAIVAILSVERVADEATVAGLRAEQTDLPLELNRRGRDQRDAESDARIADGQPGREIVASVDDSPWPASRSAALLGSMRSWIGLAFTKRLRR